MTTELADVLRQRLSALPFLERIGGVAHAYPIQEGSGEETRTVRVPVTSHHNGVGCDNDLLYLVPSETTASVAFFEDGGSTSRAVTNGVDEWATTLRLLVWLHPASLSTPLPETQLVQALLTALQLRRRGTDPPFNGLHGTARVLPGGAALWGAYSLDTPLLQPPYQLVGLEIEARYTLSACPPAQYPTLLAPAGCFRY